MSAKPALVLLATGATFAAITDWMGIGMTGGALILGGCGGTYLGARGLVWVFTRPRSCRCNLPISEFSEIHDDRR